MLVGLNMCPKKFEYIMESLRKRSARFQEKEDMKGTIEDVSRSEDKRTEKRC
jgi:hypothetical protein